MSTFHAYVDAAHFHEALGSQRHPGPRLFRRARHSIDRCLWCCGSDKGYMPFATLQQNFRITDAGRVLNVSCRSGERASKIWQTTFAVVASSQTQPAPASKGSRMSYNPGVCSRGRIIRSPCSRTVWQHSKKVMAENPSLLLFGRKHRFHSGGSFPCTAHLRSCTRAGSIRCPIVRNCRP